MKLLAVSALVGASFAYPGMKGATPGVNPHAGIFRAIIERGGERLHEEYLVRKRMIEARQVPPPQPVILIGDLQLEGTGGTATNDRIMNCFNNVDGVTCTSTEQYTPPVRDTTECEADTCCIWSYIKDELEPLMKNADGTCNDFARNSVRLGFHDAGTWATGLTTGGADGSLLLEQTEVLRDANRGLELSKDILLPLFLRYQSYGISAADLVQFAHNVAVVVCPLGPRTLTYVGRPDWTPAAGLNPDGLLPDASASADSLINLFAAKTIGTVDLVALIGAHTTGKQTFFDPSQAGKPFDTTPGVWDVAFYSEVLNGTVPCGVFHLPSDQNIANQAGGARNGFIRMANGFPLDNGPGQIAWNGLYSKAYLRLSLLGVQNIQRLTDCTKVLPNAVTSFNKPPSAIVSCPASSSSSIASSATSSLSSASSSSSVGSSSSVLSSSSFGSSSSVLSSSSAVPSSSALSSSSIGSSSSVLSSSSVIPSSSATSSSVVGSSSSTASLSSVRSSSSTASLSSVRSSSSTASSSSVRSSSSTASSSSVRSSSSTASSSGVRSSSSAASSSGVRSSSSTPRPSSAAPPHTFSSVSWSNSSFTLGSASRSRSYSRGQSAVPTFSAPTNNGYGAGAGAGSSIKGYGPGSSSKGYGPGPQPSVSGKPYYPGDGSWGYHTKTITVTKTKTITLDDGSVTTSCWNEPTTTVVPNDGPYKTETVTVTKTKTITLANGSVTTTYSKEYLTTTIWDDAWTFVSAKAAPTEAACKPTKVIITTTVYV